VISGLIRDELRLARSPERTASELAGIATAQVARRACPQGRIGSSRCCSISAGFPAKLPLNSK
jgi:hypothetical protein